MRRSGFQRKAPDRPVRPDRSAEFASVTIERPRARMAVLLQADAPAPVQKDTPHYSRAWREAVASLPACVRCGRVGVVPAHRNEGKSMGAKVDDCLTAALCDPCHMEIDQGKDMEREERRREIDRAILKTLVLLFRAGKVRVV